MTNYDGQVLCGVDDRLGAFGEMCRWPSPDITWSIVGNLPGIEPDSFRRVCGLAWDAWAKICGIRPRFVEGPSNLSIGLQTLSPGGVLADCELPCGATMQSRLKMRVDTAESWVISDNPPNNRVDLLRVLIHELGHAIGIPHIGNGNLMAPVYSSQISRPTTGDANEGVVRYGTPSQQPPPTPTIPGEYKELCAVLEKGGSVFFRKNGVISPL